MPIRGNPGIRADPPPAGTALIFQIYRGLDSLSNRVTKRQLDRVGYEFRLITRVS